MLTERNVLVAVSALLFTLPAVGQMSRFVGTVEDTFRGSLVFEVESPLRDGAWLRAGQVESSGSRNTQVEPVEGGRVLRVTMERWKDAVAPTVTETLMVPEIEATGETEPMVMARRRLATIEQWTAGGLPCGPSVAPGSACHEIDQFLPLPELPWVITAVNGTTISLEATTSPDLLGVPISRLSATVERTTDVLRWSVHGQSVDATSPITITGAAGSPEVVQVPTRVTLSLEGSSTQRPVG
jgi:hypothetical protein